jgi:Ankyrin repeat
MVSWGDETVDHARDTVVIPETVAEAERSQKNEADEFADASATPPPFRLDLIPFAQNCVTEEDYDLLREHIMNPSLSGPGTMRDFSNEDERFQSEEMKVQDDAEIRTSLLHAVLQSKGANKIPLDVIQCMVEMGGSKMVEFQDDRETTPLHLAVSETPKRIDIIRFLLRKAPEIVWKENELHLRPIDLMSHKIIMAEEGLKYEVDKEGHEDELVPMWEGVDCLVKASLDPDNFESSSMPLLHSCLISIDFPFSLMQRAIKRFPNQLEIPNQHGDLPLHLLVSRPPSEGNAIDDIGDLFSLMLQIDPEAATVLNKKGQSPLAIAIENGHNWQSKVLHESLSRTPASIGTVAIPPKVFPYLLEQVVRTKKYPTAIFELLRSKLPG